MNPVIAAIGATFVIGVAYFICAMFKHGTCDIGKMFNLLVIVGSMVTGIYLCIHAWVLAKSSQPDGAWVGVAGLILAVFSLQQGVLIFRELFARRVQPSRLDENTPTK